MEERQKYRKTHFCKKTAIWTLEIFHILRRTIFHSILGLNKNPPKHYSNYEIGGKIPTILIPGITGTWAYMKKLGDEISRQGYPVYTIPELCNNLFEIPKSAEVLKKLIEKLKQKGATRIILVAHSKGGLIGKYFLTHYNKGKEVIGMIAVSTPFSGSAISEFIPHRAFRELRASSKVILDLQKHSEVNRLIMSVYPEYDTMVRSGKESYLRGAAENIEVPICGHNLIFSNKILHKAVLSAVEEMNKKL